MTTDPGEPSPTPVVRASDVDREAAAEHVRAAVADGRLGMDELDERLTAIYQARTRGELEVTTKDLEVSSPALQPLSLQTKSGSLHRKGLWTAPAEINAEVQSGSIKLDFTQARVPHREILVRAKAKSGGVVLVVPYGWTVVMDDVSSTSGTIANKVGGDVASAHQIVRVVGSVRSGTIKARYPRRSFWDWLMRRPHSAG